MDFAFVIEYVPDVDAARRFYEAVLGLKAQRYAPNFVQYDHFALTSDEPLGGRDEPELYWVVDDAEAALRELSTKAEVAMPFRQLPFGKVFAVKDPAGRPRYLLEWAAQRPSQTVD
jgi:catechol 2,3-dioxygenase-like lactoylglutathione lyase family enzyme